MPYPAQFVKVNMEGHFGSSTTNIVENWVAGFHISSTGGGSFDPANLLTFLTAIAPAVQTFHTTLQNGVGSSTYLDSLSAAYIGVDGKYVLGGLQPTTRYTYPTPVAGAGSGIGPYSAAMVWTLRSLTLRGPASHGRVYYPACAIAVTPATGVVGITYTSSIADTAKVLLNTVNTQAAAKFGTGSLVSLVSKVGAGKIAPVVKVGAGQRLDSMESRERKIPEAYYYGTLAVSTQLERERDDDLRDAFWELRDDEDQA